MTIESILQAVLATYAGSRAKTDVARIYRYSRHITNAQYEASVAWCCERMRALGFDGVEQLTFPTDGQRVYGSWKTPPCWNVKQARLKLKLGGRWQTVSNHARIPTSVFPYSSPTAGEIHTRLVPATAADATGQLVFAETLDETPDALSERGALGMVTDFSPNWPGVRGPRTFLDGHRWENAYLLRAPTGLVGFSLSRRQGSSIRRELARHGSIDCAFQVEGSLGPGHLHCATGCLRGAGKPDEEVVIVAHLYEPGANDNCSGVAGAIEALRAIKTLVRQGVLPPPARTIRVVFTFEIVGFLAYFEHMKPSRKRYVAGVNPDMIGEDQKLCRSVLHVYRTPDAAATFADPLLWRLVRKTAAGALRCRPRPFLINDNIVSDPAIGISCPALIHLRDRFYHSNEDSPDKVSPDTLHRVGGAMAAFVYIAAAMNPALARETARLCVTYAARRLAKESQGDRDKVRYLVDCECMRLDRLERLAVVDLEPERQRIRAAAERLPIDPRCRAPRVPKNLAQEARSLVPVRTVIGSLSLGPLSEKALSQAPFDPTWSPKLNGPVFWSDGKRSLWDIYQRQRHEAKVPLPLKTLLDYFRFLDRHGLISLRKA